MTRSVSVLPRRTGANLGECVFAGLAFGAPDALRGRRSVRLKSNPARRSVMGNRGFKSTRAWGEFAAGASEAPPEMSRRSFMQMLGAVHSIDKGNECLHFLLVPSVG